MKDLAIAGRRIFFVIFRKVIKSCLCLALAMLVSVTVVSQYNKAYACVFCSCVAANHAVTRGVVTAQHGSGNTTTDPEKLAYVKADVCAQAWGSGTRGWIAYEFCRHREEFIVFYWWKEYVLAAMMMMTEQLVSDAMAQMFIIGTFFDAREQLETQMLFEELEAQAHKDYQTSFEMCEIGTLSRSLAASQRNGEFNSFLLSQRLQRRQMRNKNTSSAAGKGLDAVQRWQQFKTTFCNPMDNNQQLTTKAPLSVCADNSADPNPPMMDEDIDYTRLVGYPATIDIDFTDDKDSTQEQAIFALASNLYGNNVFSYFPEDYFKNPAHLDDYMYVRSIIAKRSVAQNSFGAIVGMKSAGSKNTEKELMPYIRKVMEQLGITDKVEQQQLLGGTMSGGIVPINRPSYYAQMEVLTKKLYQRPAFYTGLYDTPANVERKKAAMRAIGMIQNMDLFKSKLRSEADLAVLTELELFKAQKKLQNRMNAVRGTEDK